MIICDVQNHLKLFPHSSLHVHEGRLYGVWMIGNNYKRKKGYYGEYPPSYLERVKSLFPHVKEVLHLFSGSVDEGGVCFDVNPELEPDICGDAERLTDYFLENSFDLVLADPPYSKKDAEEYGTKYPNKAKVMRELHSVVSPGGVLVWLDTRRPIYRRDMWDFVGLIALDCGTNRLLRGVFLFTPKKTSFRGRK